MRATVEVMASVPSPCRGRTVETVKARLFVALMLPDVVVEQVDLALDPVRTASAELRWQSPTDGITLAFLGDRDVAPNSRFPTSFPGTASRSVSKAVDTSGRSSGLV